MVSRLTKSTCVRKKNKKDKKRTLVQGNYLMQDKINPSLILWDIWF